MESVGIRRKVDDLGRVVIPAAIRRSLDLQVGEEVEVSLDGDRIVMIKAADRCAFCGADDELTHFRGKGVCWSCTGALRALDREHAGEPPAGASAFF